MRVYLLFLIFSPILNASAGEITIYQPSGFGKHTIFVDGQPYGKLGYNKRMKLTLPNGRHFISGTHIDTSTVLDVIGNHIIRFGPQNMIEVCIDDARVQGELKATSE